METAMEMKDATEECLRFVPAAVEGMDGAREVAIYPDRVEVLAGETWRTFRYRTFARRLESRVMQWLKRCMGLRVRPEIVGDREFCTERRHVDFYTDPVMKPFLPPDDDSKRYGQRTCVVSTSF
jgi:hypothetical protein